MLTLTEGLTLTRLRKYFFANYNPDDVKLPCGTCTRCRNLLLKVDKGKAEQSSLPDPVDFSALEFPRITRSSGVTDLGELTNCTCSICTIARANPKESGYNSHEKSFPLGRPPTQNPRRLPVAKPVTVCGMCLQVIGKGISHPKPCGISQRHDNLAAKLMDDPRGAEIVASSVIKQKVGESSADASCISLATKGRDFSVPVPSSTTPSKALYAGKALPVSELSKLQNVTNMSYKQMENITHWYRVANGRDSIEPGALKKLKMGDRVLEDFFAIKECEMDSPLKDERQSGKKVSRPVVYCRNVSGLLDFLKEKRSFDSDSELFTKVGIDGGGGFLKVCLMVDQVGPVRESEPRPKQTFSYEKGAFQKKLKFSGVKKLMVVAIVQNVCENFDNTKILLDLTNLNAISFVSSVDMKMANCLLGLGTAASSYPCPWCEQPKSSFQKDYQGGHQLRTFAAIKSEALRYQEAVKRHRGQTKLSSAAFLSCERLPLLLVQDDNHQVIDVLPPMELHLLLGVLNNIYNHLDSSLKSSNCSITAADWSIPIGLTRSEHYGGQYNGNQCLKLLKSLDQLESLLKREGAVEAGQPALHALQAFYQVVQSCFGDGLELNFQEKINEFGTCYLKLGLPVTPKVHAILVHVPQFLTRNSKQKKGLGYWSEQASESVHHDWDALWGDYKRPITHKEYKDKLLACAIRYNSRHI